MIRMLIPRLLAVAGVLAGGTAVAADWTVLVVAGQSNALNWHAGSEHLPPDARDREILFYYESGAPRTPNSSSGGTWTTLQAQRQEPFAKYEPVFFGPEITLARAARSVDSHPIAVIKVAYYGTNLAENWQPDAPGGERLYARLGEHLARALELLQARGDRYRIGGFFWMQGETDGAKAESARAYAANLTAFIARVRKDLKAPDLPFVLGRVGPPPARGYPYQAAVRLAQVAVADRVANAAWVDTDDLPRYRDGVHLLAPGVMALGQRMAEAWARLSRAHAR